MQGTNYNYAPLEVKFSADGTHLIMMAGGGFGSFLTVFDVATANVLSAWTYS
jgi:hypothetical protein